MILSGTLASTGLVAPFLQTEQILLHLALIEGARVFWAISVEFQFYAVFGLFWFFARGVARLSDHSMVMVLVAAYLSLLDERT